MESSFWFHIVNVILHSLSTMLFTRICSKVAGFRSNYSLIAGIFFAVHPIHTESKFLPVSINTSAWCSIFSIQRCIRNCRQSGTFRMYIFLAFVFILSWVRTWWYFVHFHLISNMKSLQQPQHERPGRPFFVDQYSFGGIGYVSQRKWINSFHRQLSLWLLPKLVNAKKDNSRRSVEPRQLQIRETNV